MRDNLCGNLIPQIGAHCTYPSITSNGYYGYQPVRNQTENKSEDCEMEVDSNSSSQNVNIMANNLQQPSRKRFSTEPIEAPTFKKRRENEHIIHTFRQNKENIVHMENVTEEELLAYTHGSSLHHWKRESDL